MKWYDLKHSIEGVGDKGLVASRLWITRGDDHDNIIEGIVLDSHHYLPIEAVWAGLKNWLDQLWKLWRYEGLPAGDLLLYGQGEELSPTQWPWFVWLDILGLICDCIFWGSEPISHKSWVQCVQISFLLKQVAFFKYNLSMGIIWLKKAKEVYQPHGYRIWDYDLLYKALLIQNATSKPIAHYFVVLRPVSILTAPVNALSRVLIFPKHCSIAPGFALG